jgi:hypothetical protein
MSSLRSFSRFVKWEGRRKGGKRALTAWDHHALTLWPVLLIDRPPRPVPVRGSTPVF